MSLENILTQGYHKSSFSTPKSPSMRVFDDLSFLNDEALCSMQTHQKLIKYFERSKNGWCHPNYWRFQFFAVVSHNPNAEQILLLMQRRWTKEICSILGRSEGFYSCSTVSKEFLVLISILSWKAMYNFVLNKSHLQRSMNSRIRKKTSELAKDILRVCVCVCVVHFFSFPVP